MSLALAAPMARPWTGQRRANGTGTKELWKFCNIGDFELAANDLRGGPSITWTESGQTTVLRESSSSHLSGTSGCLAMRGRRGYVAIEAASALRCLVTT